MEGEPLLDLGHLTEVEQIVILNVLLKDAQLRSKEEGRVRKLHQTESNAVRLRSFSGAWFHEERAKRYQKGGADVVHASIRRKKHDTDVPLAAVFDGEKNNNSTLLPEQQEEGRSTEEEVHANISSTVDGKGQEDKEREKENEKSPIPRAASEPSPRTRHIIKDIMQSHVDSIIHRPVCSLSKLKGSCRGPVMSFRYVKVYLLPDNTSRSKKKTAVKRKTLNPVYDETMKHKVCRLDLQARVLSMSVWHMERMRRNLFLGEVEVRLGQWDWSQSQPTWHNLQPRVRISPDAIISRGTILFSIKFIPSGSVEGGYPLTGELHIWLREIVGLLPTKRRAPSAYVKSVVLPDESGVSGQQTRVVRGSVNPLFNHTMVYDGFQSSDLIQACAEITVWSPQPSSCLGGVRLSTGSGVSYGQSVCWIDSTKEEISVWSSVIQCPNSWVDASLSVRTNLQLCLE
ncbi:synaptotagmin-like protein 1 [Myxocyprinus asiaticus]|uniref:synaptotagmin-like protein 1 n=1 Tax=Myxocyprinus asiaticus TaxID=70543 RepID=UPI0022220C5F|nr:synaptotagmin-like protein 1 [Myxocyprinus asiaticus]